MINLLINYQKIVSWKILNINLTIRVVKFCLFSTKEKCSQWICIPYFVVLSSYFSICIRNTKQVLQIISVHVKTRYTRISPDRMIFTEFAPPGIGTKIWQTLLHVHTREGEDQFSINNVKLIAINQLVLVKAFKVIY